MIHFRLPLFQRIKCKFACISIDLEPKAKDNIQRIFNSSFFSRNKIYFFIGDANNDEIFNQIKNIARSYKRVLIVEDSSHTYKNTLALLNKYSNLVSKNSYYIVEDGICDVLKIGPQPGPLKAIKDFIKNNDKFIIDRTKERYILTYNPCGYLKRVK